MASQALQQLRALGGETGTYVSSDGESKSIIALVDPVRRVDGLGNKTFLSKTYELWMVRSESEGVKSVKVNFDTFAIRLQPDDLEETVLRITKIYPERDFGVPGDGIGMWHLEATI